MSIMKGDKMLCAVLSQGQPTGERVPIRVLQTKHHWKTNAVESVRVQTLDGSKRFVWVQPQMLTPDTSAQG